MIPRLRALRAALAYRHSAFVRFVSTNPAYLIPIFGLYGFLTCLGGLVAAVFWFEGARSLFKEPPTWLFPDATLLAFYATFGILSVGVWGHYVFLAFRAFATSMAIPRATAKVFRVVQLVAATVFAFAVLHYYVALFSDEVAYEGLHRPIPKYGWNEGLGLIDRLAFIPSAETVVDCIYFSTVTMGTVGYGDIHPTSPLAKLVTTCQIILCFALVIVVLGWTIGHPEDDEGSA